MANSYQVADCFSSLDQISLCTPDTTLGSALTHTKRSHEAVFVVDENNRFLGIVSPYQAFYKKRYLYSSKVQSSMIMPPQIIKSTPLYKVADFMVSSRIYALPVFTESDELIGVISVQDIFRGLIMDTKLLKLVADRITPKKPITASVDISLDQADQKLRQEKISRLILVDATDKVAGIIARGDIQRAIMNPTAKQRYSVRGIAGSRYTYIDDKINRGNDPVTKYATTKVSTILATSTKESILKRLINSRFNSIVLVDENNRAKSFLSTHDILHAIADFKPQTVGLILLPKSSKLMTDLEKSRVKELLEKMGEKLQRQQKLQKIELRISNVQFKKGIRTNFKITLEVKLQSGNILLAHQQGKTLVPVVREVIKKVMRQHRD